jgi:hypothetical protein
LSKRSRIVGFGSAGLLIVLGVACAVVFTGTLGQNLAFALVALGLVGATALVFYEVGLTEDRARARQRSRARRRAEDPSPESGGASVAGDTSSERSEPRPSQAPRHSDGDVRPAGSRLLTGRRLERRRGLPRRLR